MGRFIPFIILISLVALAIYAGIQSYALIKKQPISSQISLPKVELSLPNVFSRSTPTPTLAPTATPAPPTPTPNPALETFLESHILTAPSTCVSQLLGQDTSNYYLWVVCRNSTTSISVPISVNHNLSSLAQPRAGQNYESDLQKIFPQSVLSQPIFSDPNLQQALQSQLR